MDLAIEQIAYQTMLEAVRMAEGLMDDVEVVHLGEDLKKAEATRNLAWLDHVYSPQQLRLW